METRASILPEQPPRTAQSNRFFVELPNTKLLTCVLIWQPIGLLLVAFHVLLVRESIWLFPVIPLLLGILYVKAPLAGMLVFFQILIYQNLVVSLFSPGMDYLPTYVMLGGTNFVALCILAVIALYRLRAPFWRDQSRSVVWVVMAALAMTTLYTLIGAGKVGPTSALVYFRAFTSPLFAVLVGMDLGRTWGFKTVGTTLIYSVVLSIGLGMIEYCIPLDYYAWVNEVSYYQLKYKMQPKNATFYVPQDIVNGFTDVLFNIASTTPAGSLTTFRFGSSIITPTSFAYVMSVVGLIAVSLRRSGWLIVILPLMFLDGAKGALLLLFLSLTLWTVWRLTASKGVVVLSGLILSSAYITAGIVIGVRSGDYHVMGFLGGVHNLMSAPLGHGIGVGGNMSAQANAMNGQGFKVLAESFALESAVGVLFYQTGFASSMIFALFIFLAYTAPLGEQRSTRLQPVRQDLMIFAVAMIMVNGVFQEEAYSPYAAGTILLSCGCIIGNGRRQRVVENSSTKAVDYRPLPA